MPGPIFWITTVLVAVLLCTGHFCAGLWIGRELFGRKVVRRAREALIAGIANAAAQESAADDLMRQAEQLVVDSPAMLIDGTLTADLAAIRDAAAALRHALRSGNDDCREALAELAPPTVASARTPNPSLRKENASPVEIDRDKETPAQRCSRSSGRLDGEALQVAATPGLTVDATQSEFLNEGNDQGLPPLTSLSAEELERFRTGLPTRNGAERAEPRYPYGVQQFVAPVHGKTFPNPTEFRQVTCRDVSRRGVSYFSTAPPHTEQLILTLGGIPRLNFVFVRITNHRADTLDGQDGYTIGCEFVARLAPGIYYWNAESEKIETADGFRAVTVAE
jgi:hypothetical protein